eukprot:COSAG02_NODE_3558_length_6563_cov_38.861850_6_plen_257_part_00
MGRHRQIAEVSARGLGSTYLPHHHLDVRCFLEVWVGVGAGVQVVLRPRVQALVQVAAVATARAAGDIRTASAGLIPLMPAVAATAAAAAAAAAAAMAAASSSAVVSAAEPPRSAAVAAVATPPAAGMSVADTSAATTSTQDWSAHNAFLTNVPGAVVAGNACIVSVQANAPVKGTAGATGAAVGLDTTAAAASAEEVCKPAVAAAAAAAAAAAEDWGAAVQSPLEAEAAAANPQGLSAVPFLLQYQLQHLHHPLLH